MQRKFLMLGGAFSQIPAIKCAKELGYYVITCDYLPENPGHAFSDEYANISTTDKNAILEFAKANRIEGISAFASDPAAETAAFVAEQLGLAGASIRTTKILAEKDVFRKFQEDNDFNFPRYISVNRCDDLDISKIGFPCMVKPVDASGSKGVTKVNSVEELENAMKYAFAFSRCGRVIVEEYINSPYNQIHGEGFVLNGDLMFVHLGEQHFRNTVPIGTGCPSCIPEKMITVAENEVKNILGKLGFEVGAVNIEVRIDTDGRAVVVEIGPRSGGNYMPQLIELSSGFDETKACVLAAMGREKEINYIKKNNKYVFQYIIGAPANGVFRKIEINKDIENKIRNIYLHKTSGDVVEDYRSSSGVIGVILIECDDEDDLQDVINNIYQYVKVVLE